MMRGALPAEALSRLRAVVEGSSSCQSGRGSIATLLRVDSAAVLSCGATNEAGSPADGSVVDADAKALVPDAHSSPSEKLIAIDFESGKPVQLSGQNGGVYPPRSP